MAQANQRNEVQNHRQAAVDTGRFDLGPLALVLAWAPAAGLVQRRFDRWDARQRREAPVRAALGRAHRRRAKLDRLRARQLRDGEDAPAWSGPDLKALAAADLVEAQAVKGRRGAPSIRAAAAKMREAVADRRAAAHEARRGALRLEQTVALDAGREGVASGEVVERRRGQGQVRLRTRDGLKLLHERGGLGADRVEAARLLAVGLRYRDLYELAQASLKSCLAVSDRVSRGERTLWADAMAAHRRAALANQVRRIEARVATAAGPDALEVLRKVAGEACTVRSLCANARQRVRMESRLMTALTLAGEILCQPR